MKTYDEMRAQYIFLRDLTEKSPALSVPRDRTKDVARPG